MSARCPKFTPEQESALLDLTRRSVKRKQELGMNLYSSPESPEFGERCAGDNCSITLPGRKLHRQFGSFHTHVKSMPLFGRFDTYTSLARWDTHLCVGGMELNEPVVRCYAAERGPRFEEGIARASDIEEQRRKAKTALDATDMLPLIFDVGDTYMDLYREVCEYRRGDQKPRQVTLF